MTNERKIELILFLDEKGYVVEGISDEDDYSGYKDDLTEKKEMDRVKVLIYRKDPTSDPAFYLRYLFCDSLVDHPDNGSA